MILPGASFSDLDRESIQRFMNLFRNKLKNTVFGAFSEAEVLRKLGLVRKEKNKTQITAAAMLLLGKELSLKNWFPSFKMDYLEVPGIQWGGTGETRWTYRIPSESNLVESYLKIMPRLQMRVPMPFVMKKDGITRDEDSPALLAIREAFVNLMAHADYFDRKSAFIKVFDDRIEFFNGGCLLFDVRLLSEGNISEPRNPLLIRAFRALNLAEEIGSGFVKIFDGWQAANFAIPEIISDRRNNFCRLTFSIKKTDGTLISPVIAAKENSDASINASKETTASPKVTHRNASKEMDDASKDASKESKTLSAGLNEIQVQILSEVLKKSDSTYEGLSKLLKKDMATIRRNIQKMKQLGVIKRAGGRKSGHWEVLKQ